MSEIFDEIKASFQRGTMLTRLIYVNLGVFLVFMILGVVGFLFKAQIQAAEWFMLPADISRILTKPWSIFTYMFLHTGFLHILFNMIWLYFGGRIFLEYLNNRKLLSTYLLGGLAGGLLYILSFNALPVFQEILPKSQALGASASVLAILIAIATFVPNYTVRLFVLGDVKLKYIAIFSVAMDVISIPSGNAGGHIAHLGGALFGYLYATQLKNGKNISAGLERFLDRFFNWISSLGTRNASMKTVYRSNSGSNKSYNTRSDQEYHANREARQNRMDEILDKIKDSGYESLTAEERKFLFEFSKE
jgi:membrane associated rhomboid family serine protease